MSSPSYSRVAVSPSSAAGMDAEGDGMMPLSQVPDEAMETEPIVRALVRQNRLLMLFVAVVTMMLLGIMGTVLPRMMRGEVRSTAIEHAADAHQRALSPEDGVARTTDEIARCSKIMQEQQQQTHSNTTQETAKPTASTSASASGSCSLACSRAYVIVSDSDLLDETICTLTELALTWGYHLLFLQQPTPFDIVDKPQPTAHYLRAINEYVRKVSSGAQKSPRPLTPEEQAAATQHAFPDLDYEFHAPMSAEQRARECSGCPSDTGVEDLYLFADTRDVLMQRGPDALHSTWLRVFRPPLVFSGEPNCWPAHLQSAHPTSVDPHDATPYLNSGVMVGTLDGWLDAMQIYDRITPRVRNGGDMQGCIDDQCVWMTALFYSQVAVGAPRPTPATDPLPWVVDRAALLMPSMYVPDYPGRNRAQFISNLMQWSDATRLFARPDFPFLPAPVALHFNGGSWRAGVYGDIRTKLLKGSPAAPFTLTEDVWRKRTRTYDANRRRVDNMQFFQTCSAQRKERT